MLKFSGYSCLIGGPIEKTHFSFYLYQKCVWNASSLHENILLMKTKTTTCFVLPPIQGSGHPQGIRFENAALKQATPDSAGLWV